MASIRRTLSPYHNRPYQNGGSPFSVQSPSHKLLSTGNSHSPLSTFSVRVSRLIAGDKYSRKGQYTWRKSSFRLLVFFLLGCVLGFAPFGDFDDAGAHDFSFQNKAPEVAVGENLGDLVISAPKDEFVLDNVELAIEKKRNDVKERFDFSPRKQLIVVTPTYNRALQAYYLNRLGQLLRLVPPPLIWIVVEMNAASMETAAILREMGIMYRHLVCMKNSTSIKDRGVHQRNTALEHIKQHKLDGIVYFADDDNMYSLELFEKMRELSRFGTWPVGMLAQSKSKAILEGPVCNGSQVIGWNTNEKSKRLRRFHVDMSGFAFNSTILWDPKRWKRPTSAPVRQLDTVKEGFQETTFIAQVVEDESQMEGTPPGCSRIMNWHLHLESIQLSYPGGWLLERNLKVNLPIK